MGCGFKGSGFGGLGSGIGVWVLPAVPLPPLVASAPLPGHSRAASRHLRGAPGHLRTLSGHLRRAPGHFQRASGHLRTPGHPRRASAVAQPRRPPPPRAGCPASLLPGGARLRGDVESSPRLPESSPRPPKSSPRPGGPGERRRARRLVGNWSRLIQPQRPHALPTGSPPACGFRVQGSGLRVQG